MKKGNWTIADLERLKAEGKIQGWVDRRGTANHRTPAKSKYGNRKTEYNGIRFDSEKECKDYKHLLWQQKQGLIGQLRLQVPFELNEGGAYSYKYVADFTWIDAQTGVYYVADSKGFMTTEFKKKQKLMKKVHGIDIKIL